LNNFFSGLVEKLEPYVPGEQPKNNNYIKLNTNENPYPPSPKVIRAIKEAANEDLRLYPDPECEKLRNTASDYYNIDAEQIFVGNGSDEVLAFSFGAFFADRRIFFPDITYSFYPVYAKLYNVAFEKIPLDRNFEINEADYFMKDGGIIIPNPNAPTSKYLDLNKIEEILKTNKENVVLIDEAYIDFGGDSCTSLLNKYSNLLVVQTLSKSRSLAGLRVGFAFGSEELISGLNRIKNSFNSYTLDRIALVGATEALKDDAYFKEKKNKIIQTREETSHALKTLNFNVLDSKTNFIFISHERLNAEYIFNKLRGEKILIRYFNQPRINNFLRVTIGTDREMQNFIKSLEKII